MVIEAMAAKAVVDLAVMAGVITYSGR